MREFDSTQVLHVLLYDQLDAYGEDLELRISEIPWIRIHHDLATEEISELLDEVNVLLRPTSADGDSGIVREALAQGVTVIASNVAPRPSGVVLAELSIDGFIRAWRDRSPISEGNGLGEPLDDALTALMS